MQYSFRCILDVETDVIRDISINANATLQDFHKAISNACEFSTQEMAAFYRTNKDREQGEEIPLINMSITSCTNEMKDYKLSKIFSKINDRLLYIYDFLVMWTFYIELREININLSPNESTLVYGLGLLPNKAPEKYFTSKKIADEFETEFDDDLDIEENDSDFY